MQNDFDPFSVWFNILKMKYKDYDESLSSMNFLQSNDKINLFINLETIWKHLSMVTDLERKIMSQQDFDTIIISNILNLAAHYKRFFVNNGLDTKVYLYHTDFLSDEFNQFRYNDDYRSYYRVKYNQNPKFVLLTERLLGKILPDVRIYCEFIPNVYYISAHNIEGSIIPYLISKKDPSRKNLIVGGELYDTQYSFIPNFVNHYIHRGSLQTNIYTDISGYIKDITNKDDEDGLHDTFSSYSFYCSLMAVLGDKIRSIDGVYGIGPATFNKCIKDGLNTMIIQGNTTSPEILGDVFHDNELKDEFINNFYCSAILNMYDELTDGEKTSIITQIIDRSDINTLQALNRTKFINHPLLLEGLLI